MRADEGSCDDLAHVVMPDHLHWLVQLQRYATLQDIVRRVKGRSARRINLTTSSPLQIWQSGYHDHAVRAEEDIEDIANYLIHNPVRAGLVADVNAYPFWDSVWHLRRRCRG